MSLTSSPHGQLIVIKRSCVDTKRKMLTVSVFIKKHYYEFILYFLHRIRKLAELDCHSVSSPKAVFTCTEHCVGSRHNSAYALPLAKFVVLNY
jgi:hypothetical protein